MTVAREQVPARATTPERLQRTASLDVVIVSYRRADLLADCLDALEAHPPRCPMTVHVVENGADARVAALVKSRYPGVRFYVADGNIGFARASNVALRAGRCGYALLLNPDTRITAGALDRLLDLMEEQSEVGIAGCRLVTASGTLDHAARRAFPTVLGAIGHFSGIGRRRTTPGRLSQYRALDVDAGPVDAVNGAFMLIRRSALDDVGLLDEGYWMFMEDLDLCYRFRQAGWLTWYEPDVTVVHLKGAIVGRPRSPRLECAFHYGMYRFYRKFYAPERPRLVNLAVYAGIAGKTVLALSRWPAARAAVALRRRLHRAREG